MKKSVFLGRRIRALRTRMRLSQAELAKRLGVSPTYLNLLEHDRRPVTTALLLELARVLDVDLRVLSSGADRVRTVRPFGPASLMPGMLVSSGPDSIGHLPDGVGSRWLKAPSAAIRGGGGPRGTYRRVPRFPTRGPHP